MIEDYNLEVEEIDAGGLAIAIFGKKYRVVEYGDTEELFTINKIDNLSFGSREAAIPRLNFLKTLHSPVNTDEVVTMEDLVSKIEVLNDELVQHQEFITKQNRALENMQELIDIQRGCLNAFNKNADNEDMPRGCA